MYTRISLLSLVAEATLEGVQLLQRAASHTSHEQQIDNCHPNLDWAALTPLCHPDKSFDFQGAMKMVNNLGGFGPEANPVPILRLGDVIPGKEPQWDLRVSVTDTPGNKYQPNTYHGGKNGFTKNGAHGSFLKINMLTGTVTNFTFSFEDRSGGPLTLPEPIYLSVMDFDEGRANASREFAIFDPPCQAVFTFEADQELQATCSDTQTKLVSTHTGGKVGNPEHPRALKAHQKKRAATCLLPAGIDHFTVKLGEINYAHEQGRNFIFSGPSNLVCPAFQSCQDYSCPNGYTKKKNDEFIFCEHATCLESGEGKVVCCDATNPPAKPGALNALPSKSSRREKREARNARRATRPGGPH